VLEKTLARALPDFMKTAALRIAGEARAPPATPGQVHTQASAIEFIEYVIERLLFRADAIRKDNSHGFQIRFQ
jgi:hypothetical protein